MTKRWDGVISAKKYFEPEDDALLDAIIFVLEQKLPAAVDILSSIEIDCSPDKIGDAETVGGELRWTDRKMLGRKSVKVSAKMIFIPYHKYDKDGVKVTVGKQVFYVEGLERKVFKFVTVKPRFRRTYLMPITERKDKTEPKYDIGVMCRSKYDDANKKCEVLIEGTKKSHKLLESKPDVIVKSDYEPVKI